MKQKIFFNKNEYNKSYPSGSAPACINGTPKMHKFSSSESFSKLRPIVSSIGTFNYNLACFQKNSCFYDVTSLFTNIPLQEAIDIAINHIWNHNFNLRITKKELKKLFHFAALQTHFIFNSKFYNQIDGVAMGSPLAPVLANIFMGFYESNWLNEYNLNKPNFYLRYVDDILAAFDNEQDSWKFLGFIKKKAF